MFRVIGYSVRCTSHFQVLALITNSGSNPELTENLYMECCEPTKPDLNQVGFEWYCQL